MIDPNELASWNENICIRVYEYKGKLIEVWWGKKENKWEFVYSPGGPMCPPGHHVPTKIDGNDPMLDRMIEHGLYQEASVAERQTREIQDLVPFGSVGSNPSAGS